MNALTQTTFNRQELALVQEAMEKQPQLNLRVEHFFSLGVYARQVYIPKGAIAIGHIHKYQNLNILLKGKIQVLIGDKLEVKEAPFTVVSPAGTKRIVKALEDCIWMTIHGTNEKDINVIENHFIAHSEQEYLEFAEANQLALDLK